MRKPAEAIGNLSKTCPRLDGLGGRTRRAGARKQREIQLGCGDGTFPLYLSYAGFRGTWSGSVGNPAEYRRYARECLELAGNSQVRRARDALHHMAHVWLRLAQEAEVQISSSSPEENQHENDRA